ncbi:MAG: hypothetical protein AAGA03_10550 [Planctomycetota bacterium]
MSFAQGPTPTGLTEVPNQQLAAASAYLEAIANWNTFVYDSDNDAEDCMAAAGAGATASETDEDGIDHMATGLTSCSAVIVNCAPTVAKANVTASSLFQAQTMNNGDIYEIGNDAIACAAYTVNPSGTTPPSPETYILYGDIFYSNGGDLDRTYSGGTCIAGSNSYETTVSAGMGGDETTTITAYIDSAGRQMWRVSVWMLSSVGASISGTEYTAPGRREVFHTCTGSYQIAATGSGTGSSDGTQFLTSGSAVGEVLVFPGAPPTPPALPGSPFISIVVLNGDYLEFITDTYPSDYAPALTLCESPGSGGGGGGYGDGDGGYDDGDGGYDDGDGGYDEGDGGYDEGDGGI